MLAMTGAPRSVLPGPGQSLARGARNLLFIDAAMLDGQGACGVDTENRDIIGIKRLQIIGNVTLVFVVIWLFHFLEGGSYKILVDPTLFVIVRCFF
jgi:hypothetical protein